MSTKREAAGPSRVSELEAELEGLEAELEESQAELKLERELSDQLEEELGDAKEEHQPS